MKINLLYIGLFVAILVFSYWLIVTIAEFKRRQYINDFLGNMNKRYVEREKERKYKYLYEGVTNEKKVIDKIDELIDRSSIKVLIPIINSEIFIALLIVLSLLASWVANNILHFWIYTIGAFFGTIFIVVLILKYMARKTYDRIDDQILLYINTLINLCGANDDIVTIIDKAVPYLNAPLKQFSEQFVFESRKGMPLQQAFKNFEDKIESKRFRQLLKNLEICSKHEANYKQILNKSRVIMKHYFVEKERRKKAVMEGRVTILFTILMGVFLFKLVGSFSDNLMESLKHNIIGNFILGYMLFVILYSVYRFITLDKLNY